MNGDVLNAEIISIITMGASIAALILVLYRGLRADMAQQRNAISALGTQIRQEMNESRQELKQDIGKLEQRINELRQELEQRIGELRREAKQDRQDIARDLKVLGERTARVQGAVTGLVWDDVRGEAEAVSRPVVSPRPEAEA